MMPAWDPQALHALSMNALAQTGLPIVPEVQRELESQLSQIIFARVSGGVKDAAAQAFSQQLADTLHSTIQQQLEQALQSASLAAIAEFALPQAGTARRPSRPVASEEMLAGLSETPSDLAEDVTTTTSRVSSESSAPAGAAPYPSTIPTEAAPGGMPTTLGPRPAPQSGAPAPGQRPAVTGQAGKTPADATTTTPAAASTPEASTTVPNTVSDTVSEPDEPGEADIIDQSKEQAIANTLAATKRRRAAAGQPDLSGQQQASYHYGLNLVADAGTKAGNKLKDNIKNGKFTSFYICLLLALVKDVGEIVAVAYFDPGITGDILSAFIGFALTAILLGEGTYFRRWLIKKFFGKAIVAFIIGLIPGVNIVFPEYTVGILLMGWDNRKAILDMKHKLADLQKQMGQLKKMAAAGPRGLAKAKAKLQPFNQAADA